MLENCIRCDSCAQTEQDIIAINTRVQALEHSCTRMREAFLINDLGLPDYEGHRNGHRTMVNQAKVVDTYKQSATKRVIDILIGGAMALLISGIVAWFKEHLK